ncbi:hypothetical protein M7I_7620 [Glarea lozoyensis 74030]|uniref:Uncharacterized protein n=1 Tax=Glarea lozoyensis (strain ATCC 74030 / MF5533) TaxID=1104152 RepID=H0EXT1_GLAL7|nr:hypothetical protein M7I_7620 [Glarea lozoyensis 74030]
MSSARVVPKRRKRFVAQTVSTSGKVQVARPSAASDLSFFREFHVVGLRLNDDLNGLLETPRYFGCVVISSRNI